VDISGSYTLESIDLIWAICKAESFGKKNVLAMLRNI
jgi:hypothetical protein